MKDDSPAELVMSMEAAAVTKVGGEPVHAVSWSVGQPITRANTTPAPVGTQGYIQATLARTEISSMLEVARGRVLEITPPNRDEAIVPVMPRDGGEHRLEFITVALLVLGCGWVAGSNFDRFFDLNGAKPTEEAAVNAIVERIIQAESDGGPNAKDKRSSATGAGQFLDGTWLEMIRVYRPDLVPGRSAKEILKLRQDPEVAREITTRFVAQNAAILSGRDLPVTPGTLYLAHFAGAAGAVAILSVPGNADAASIMASADATGRTTREKIVEADPFLRDFTAADLLSWADRKMRGLDSPAVDQSTN